MAGKNANKTNKPLNPAENAVFNDAGNTPAKIQDKPITNDNGGDAGDAPEMSQIPTKTLTEILERLNTLETKETVVARTDDSEIFDPLSGVKGDSMARIAYVHNPSTGSNDLVLAYIPRKMADGREKETWIEKDEKTGELRTKCSIVCMNENGEQYKRENIDYVAFLESIETRACPIKNRKDIGKPVKQDYTIQRIWNGRQLAPTPMRVQTGYVEQKFEYDIEVDGEIIHFKQNVINIR